MSAIQDRADVERLFTTGAHFAQVKSRRHPSMQPYLLGAQGGKEIIDLAKTSAQLEAAATVMAALAKEGKTVLFVGGKIEVAALVKKAAESIDAPYVATRWLGGTISNWSEIKKRIDRLAELIETTGGTTKNKEYTKLELVRLDREKNRLALRLDGLTTLDKRPHAMLVVDTKHEKHAVKEARDAGIPVIGIMSSDCNVADAAYPIVANDSSRETVKLILNQLTEAYKQARAQ